MNLGFQNLAGLPKATRSSYDATPTKTSDVSSQKEQFDITPNTREKIITLEKTQSHQLDQLRQEIALKRNEMENLRNRHMQLTTSKQELELNQEILHGKFYQSAKTASAKEAELDGLDDMIDSELKNLHGTAELHKKELILDHQARLQKLTKTFEDKVDETLRNKVKVVSLQKQSLQKQLDAIQLKIDVAEEGIKDRRNAIVLNYKTKLEEVSSMIYGAQATLRQELSQIESEMANSKASIDELIGFQIPELKKAAVNMEDRWNLLVGEKNERSDALAQISNKISSRQNELSQLIANTKTIKNDTVDGKRRLNEIADATEHENYKRRHLNNILQDLKGNIRVFCRVRPPLANEKPLPLAEITFPENVGEDSSDQVILEDSSRVNAPKKTHQFKFDKVFNMNASNSTIFAEISPLIQSCINGYNTCIFAYGQTGSGKTYTMSEKEIGMIPRTVHQIFQDIKKLTNLPNQPWDFELSGSFLEIYNDSIIDLISDSFNPAKKHEIRHDTVNMRTRVTDLTEVTLTCTAQVDQLLARANKNRSTASTKANERSSRSHSVFILNIKGSNKITGDKMEGVLNLVDLAGSERLSTSQASGQRLKETQAINKSLSALGDVIAALKQNGSSSNNGAVHIPFRNSKLTYLLQYSLIGKSKTLMFVNVSPMAAHLNETVNSLRFAMKVNSTKIF